MGKPIYETEIYKVVVGEVDGEKLYQVVHKEYGVIEQQSHSLPSILYECEYQQLHVSNTFWMEAIEEERSRHSKVAVPLIN